VSQRQPSGNVNIGNRSNVGVHFKGGQHLPQHGRKAEQAEREDS